MSELMQFEGIATVSELGHTGMITIRGDHSDAAFSAALKPLGLSVPAQRKIVFAGKAHDSAVAWMSPDELLVFVPAETHAKALADVTKALESTHALVVDVSDARALFRIQGDHAREVLGKVMPIDLSPEIFTEGDFRRSRLAQVAAAIWQRPDGAFDLMCFRSVGEYGYQVLKTSAENNTEVGFYSA